MSTDQPSSPTAKARSRLQGTGDQASYMNSHSVVPLLNDLLGSVVENKPEDVLSYLIDYLSNLQADVTRARQMLERKNKGAGPASPTAPSSSSVVEEVIAAGIAEEVEAKAVAPPAISPIAGPVATSNNTSEAVTPMAGFSAPPLAPTAAGSPSQPLKRAAAHSQSLPRFTNKRAQSASGRRLIEVHVDGEVQMIPDYDADEELPPEDIAAIGGGGGAGDKQNSTMDGGPSSRSPSVVAVGGGGRAVSPSAVGGASASAAATLIVQEPLALRYLLKAAERQKTPSLSILVDLARAKASAIADGNTGLTKQRRVALAAASNLGIELLQRSSAGEQYQSLSILNNHWMVRRQIVYAVEDPIPPPGSSGMAPAQAMGSLVDNSTAIRRIGSDGGMHSISTRSVSPPPSAAVGGPSPSLSPQQSPSGLPQQQQQQQHSQRMILVQDPTPIRLLLKAAEKQHTPSLSLLIDFARKRYGSDKTAAGPSGVAGSGVTSSSSPAGDGGVTNPNLFGIELLQRSHAKSSGLPSLGILSNHWMVRRQIVVAVKDESGGGAAAGAGAVGGASGDSYSPPGRPVVVQQVEAKQSPSRVGTPVPTVK